MKKSKTVLLTLLVMFFVAQAVIHTRFVFPGWRANYSPNKGEIAVPGLNPEHLLLAVLGPRELIAGILWVRADSFFDTGNYDAVLPIIRLVTILDPKQIDVYATGMWHIAYNFTDEEQRSDRRYIKPALALGREGSEKNPATYELFFETGWTWYHKVDDEYHQAVKWFEDAAQREDMPPARKNLIAKAYERNGDLTKMLDHYVMLRDQGLERVRKKFDYSEFNVYDTIENNLENLLVRLTQRGWLARQRNDGSYEVGRYDTLDPHNVAFSARVTVDASRVLSIDGTWNVAPIGSRIRVVVRDADYDTHKAAGLDWGNQPEGVNIEPERDRTIMQDSLFVRNGRFSKRIDLSKDVTMYPFKSPNYIIEFYYNPRSAPDHLKDKFGFNGEGMTDPNFLNTEIRPGQRVIYTKLEATRDQLLREGEWLDRAPVIKTENYKTFTGVGDNDIIILPPSIRSGGN